MVDSQPTRNMKMIEELMSEIVDRMAADPNVAVNPRAWAQLLVYAPTELKLAKRPVAFRYKNDVDEWVLTANEADTQHALDTGHDAQALFLRVGTFDAVSEAKRQAYLDQRQACPTPHEPRQCARRTETES